VEEVVCIFSFIWFVYVLFFSQPSTVCISYAYGTLWPVCAVSRDLKGGAKDIKMVRQNRDAAGAEASAEGTIIEAPIPSPAD